MCSFKLFNQNVCTVNVHEMYYKFNPGPSPNCTKERDWDCFDLVVEGIVDEQHLEGLISAPKGEECRQILGHLAN
jgi:hypothetical protein